MYTFLISVVLLIGGYFIYGKFVEKVFGVNPEAKTPAYKLTDGVDFVPMGWGKIFLIQFLNIAGLGPIFGAIMGATFGPSAFFVDCFWLYFRWCRPRLFVGHAFAAKQRFESAWDRL